MSKASNVSTEPEAVAAELCPYCAGKGGRYRMVYSRFLGTNAQVHQGPWEPCWACRGTGEDRDAEKKT